MEERLRSISKRIHWSSLLRAAVFAAAWLFLPFWIFVAIALYLYFIPWFHPGRLAWPFFALLLLAFLEPPPLASASGVLLAAVFGAVFYGILIVKDLIALERRSWYEVIILALSFFFIRGFYAAFSDGVGAAYGSAGLFYAFLLAAVIAILLKSFLGAFPEDGGAAGPVPPDDGAAGARLRRDSRIKLAAAWMAFLIFSQLFVVGLFLPLDFAYQSAVMFLLAAFTIDVVSEYAHGGAAGIPRDKTFAISAAAFSLLVVILAAAPWGL